MGSDEKGFIADIQSVSGSMDTEGGYNKLLVEDSFNDTLEELKKLRIRVPKDSSPVIPDLESFYFPPEGELVSAVDKIEKVRLDPEAGARWAEGRLIAAYDESIRKFSAIEGTAYFTAHSLVLLKNRYIPVSLITFYFYTRAHNITSKFIKYSEDPAKDSERDYAIDRIGFLRDYAPEASILFIDGPIIGGDMYTMMIGHLRELREKSIIPVFFVKNSTSNLVTDNIPELRGKYNSDFHWSYTFLKPGERTNFFRYVDRHNPRNAKVFCYLKAFDLSPQRVELDLKSFESNYDAMQDLMNCVYYLLLAQGDAKNPQVRPIAVAERYAREVLSVIDIDRRVRGLTPTMNQTRFG